MALYDLESDLKDVLKQSKDKSFGDLIRECRIAIGLKLYRAAEYIGIAKGRLNNIESGFFKRIPRESEIDGLSRLYGINRNVLIAKAVEHVRTHQRKRRIDKRNIRLCCLREEKASGRVLRAEIAGGAAPDGSVQGVPQDVRCLVESAAQRACEKQAEKLV